MDDWQRVKSRLAELLTITGERRRGLRARLPDGRTLYADVAAGLAGDPWLVLRVPVCRAGELAAEEVAERNGRLVFAALVLVDGQYVFRLAVPLASSEARVLDVLISQVADAAWALRPHVSPAHGVARLLFSHYAK